MKNAAKEYWELGVISLVAYTVAKNPHYKPLFELLGFGVAAHCGWAFKNYQKTGEITESIVRMIRNIPYFLGMAMLLDRNMGYVKNLTETGKFVIPSVLMASSAAISIFKEHLMNSQQKSEAKSKEDLEKKVENRTFYKK